MDKIVNWTKLKIGQNWKLEKLKNWTKLEKLDKVGQSWTEFADNN